MNRAVQKRLDDIAKRLHGDCDFFAFAREDVAFLLRLVGAATEYRICPGCNEAFGVGTGLKNQTAKTCSTRCKARVFYRKHFKEKKP